MRFTLAKRLYWLPLAAVTLTTSVSSADAAQGNGWKDWAKTHGVWPDAVHDAIVAALEKGKEILNDTNEIDLTKVDTRNAIRRYRKQLLQLGEEADVAEASWKSRELVDPGWEYHREVLEQLRDAKVEGGRQAQRVTAHLRSLDELYAVQDAIRDFLGRDLGKTSAGRRTLDEILQLVESRPELLRDLDGQRFRSVVVEYCRDSTTDAAQLVQRLAEFRPESRSDWNRIASVFGSPEEWTKFRSQLRRLAKSKWLLPVVGVVGLFSKEARALAYEVYMEPLTGDEGFFQPLPTYDLPDGG